MNMKWCLMTDSLSCVKIHFVRSRLGTAGLRVEFSYLSCIVGYKLFCLWILLVRTIFFLGFFYLCAWQEYL
jgi:hypothetical protein